MNNNALTNLDLTKCEKLKTSSVQNNRLPILDVGNNSQLSNLTADEKAFVKFVKFNTALKVNESHQIEGIRLVKKTSFINKGRTLSDNDSMTTGTILRTSLGSIISEYKFVVLGDITGIGEVNASDVARLYQYYKYKIDIEGEYILVGDMTGDGQIAINDLSKID